MIEIELNAKPELTYGLVVGIEKYLETAWSVPGGGLRMTRLSLLSG